MKKKKIIRKMKLSKKKNSYNLTEDSENIIYATGIPIFQRLTESEIKELLPVETPNTPSNLQAVQSFKDSLKKFNK